MSSDTESAVNPSVPLNRKAPNEDKASKSGVYADKAAQIAAALERAPVVPKALVPYIDQISKVIVFIISLIELSIPYFQIAFEKANAFWLVLQPYNPELLIPSFIGLIMCFFGGSFLTLIAAVEAYRMIGFNDTITAFKVLIQDAKKMRDADKKDDEEDLDGDGVADVNQISKEKLVTRKTLLFLRTIDPVSVSDALTAINSGFLAVIATLKLQFAKAITLGHAIAHSLETPANKFLLPHIEASIPADYRKWASPLLHYTINAISISIAWSIQRVISAFHSATRGGFMFTRNTLKYLSVKNYLVIDHETTTLDEIGGFIIAAIGLYFQLSTGFSLPFPLNILLFPFSIAEYTLMWIINQ